MREIIVKLLLNFDTEEDIHPKIMLDDIMPRYIDFGFEILADSAGIDSDIPTLEEVKMPSHYSGQRGKLQAEEESRE